MKIEEIVLYRIELPLLQFFETSFERIYTKSAILIEIKSDGISGWGECVADRAPFYSSEDITTSWHILEDYLIPEILGRPIEFFRQGPGPGAAVKGHRMAKAAVNSALWDLTARQREMPLWKLMGGTRQKIACGVSIGIQDTPEQLLDLIARELASGYKRIKIKIKPGWDLGIIEKVRQRFPEILLMADANSAYSLADTSLFLEIDQFDLMMIEQPLFSDDIFEHRKLQGRISTPICLDESIRHLRDTRAAIEMNACRIINIKQGRVGGPGEAIRIHDYCRDTGIPVWCGGMIETGIGRAHNIALSTLENFTLPGDVSAGSRYFREDIVDPPVEVTGDGCIIPSARPGIGHDPVLKRIIKITNVMKTYQYRGER